MSITKPVLNKINAHTTNCREAYLILENTYGGNLTVAEMAFLDNMLDKKKETTESAETFIENWIQLSLQTGITRTIEMFSFSECCGIMGIVSSPMAIR